METQRDYAIFMLHPDGRVATWNPGAERLKGYFAPEIIGRHFSIFYTPEDVERGLPGLGLRVAAEMGRYDDEGWRVRKDGSRFWAYVVVMALRDEAGNLLGFSKITCDLTARKLAERLSPGRARVLLRTLTALMADPDLEKFLGQAMTALVEQLDLHSCSLWIFDEKLSSAALRMTCADGRVLTGAQQLGHPNAVVSAPLNSRPAAHQPWYAERPRVFPNPVADQHLAPEYRAWLSSREIRSLLSVPVSYGNKTIGTLTVRDTRRRNYSAEEIALAQALAHYVSLAVELSRSAVAGQRAAVLEERNRTARELHDVLAQAFAGILVQLEAAEDILARDPAKARNHLSLARRLARDSLTETRRSVLALRPAALRDGDLPGAFERLAAELTDGGLRAEFAFHGATRVLPAGTADALLRIGQEALANVLKHSRAKRVLIVLAYRALHARLTIQDDGVGFDPRTRPPRLGFGLFTMRDRAETLGGRLTISSRLGRGTRIEALLPIRGAAQAAARRRG